MAYTIQRGDTLSGLAKRFGTTVSELARLNNIQDVNKIYAGNTLKLPETQKPASVPAQQASSNASSGGSAMDIAADRLKQNQSQPSGYQSPYSEQLNALLDKILNRKDFSYDMNADPLYQQYKNQYTELGQKAMQDTIGNAASLTGGYASSAANTAGSQAYQSYLKQLNNVVPELYNAAYNRYQNEGNALYEQLSALQGMDASEYARYRDTVSDKQWNDEFLYKQAKDKIDNDYRERNFAYQKDLDAKTLAAQQAAKQSSSGASSSDTLKIADKAAEAYSVGGEDGLAQYLQILVGTGLLSDGQAIAITESLSPSKQAPVSTVDDDNWRSRILMRSEFNKRKKSAASLKQYADYDAYFAAMKKKYTGK